MPEARRGFARFFFNLASSVPGIRIPAPDQGLAGSLLAAGHRYIPSGWSRQCWLGCLGDTCKQTQHGCPGQAAASATPVFVLICVCFNFNYPNLF